MSISRTIGATSLYDRFKYPWYCSIMSSSDTVLGNGVYLGGNKILTSLSVIIDVNNPYFVYDMGLTAASKVVMGSLTSSTNSVFVKIYTITDFIYHPNARRDYIQYINSDGTHPTGWNVFSWYANTPVILEVDGIPSADNFTAIELLPSDLVSTVLTPGTTLTTVSIGAKRGEHPQNVGDDVIPDVPIELVTDTVIMVTNTNIRELDVVVTSDAEWNSRCRVHGTEFHRDEYHATYSHYASHQEIPTFLVDTSKHDEPVPASYTLSYDAITVNIYTYGFNDWNVYWYYENQTQFGISAFDALNIYYTNTDYYTNLTLASDQWTHHRFFISAMGSDTTTFDDDAGLTFYDAGAPVIYNNNEKNYLVGLFVTGVLTPDTEPILNDDLPGICENLVVDLPLILSTDEPVVDIVGTDNGFRSWITRTINPPLFTDAETTRTQYVINSALDQYTSDYGYYSSLTITSDTPELWSDTVHIFNTDVNSLNNTLLLWQSDLFLVQNALDLYSSDGSIIYSNTSDYLDNIIGFTSDITQLNSDQGLWESNLNSSDANTSDIENFTSDLEIFNSIKDGITSDFEYLHKGTNGLGDLNRAIATYQSSPDDNRDIFYRLRVSNPHSIFDSNSTYDVYQNDGNDDIFETSLTGDASIAHSSNAYYSLRVTNKDDMVIRQSKSRLLYQNGMSRIVILNGVLATSSDSLGLIESKIGVWNGIDGHYFKYDEDGISVCEMSGGNETQIYKNSWNLDQMDGNGPSNIDFTTYTVINGTIPTTLDLTYSHLMMVIDTQWTGAVRMGFFIGGKPYYVHQFSHEDLIYSYQPSANLPIRYQVEKISSLDDGNWREIRMTWTSAAIEGDYIPSLYPMKYTNAHHEGTIITPAHILNEPSLVPVVSMRINENYSNAMFKLHSIDFRVGDSNIYWEFILNPTLQSDTWVATRDSPKGTIMEFDLDASMYAQGTLLHNGFSHNLGKENFITKPEDYISEKSGTISIDGTQDIVTFGVRNLGDNNSITIHYIIRWIEIH